MNWKEFLKPSKTKFILFFLLALLTLALTVIMVIIGNSEKVPALGILLLIVGWIMVAPFVVVSIAGLFLGNLLGGLGILMVPVFFPLAIFIEALFLYFLSCMLAHLKNKIKK